MCTFNKVQIIHLDIFIQFIQNKFFYFENALHSLGVVVCVYKFFHHSVENDEGHVLLFEKTE